MYRINHIHLEAFHKQHNKLVQMEINYMPYRDCIVWKKENFEVWQLSSALTFEYTLSVPEHFIANS